MIAPATTQSVSWQNPAARAGPLVVAKTGCGRAASTAAGTAFSYIEPAQNPGAYDRGCSWPSINGRRNG